MTVQCIRCPRAVDDPVPASWLEKFPELAGMCKHCATEYVGARIAEGME